MAATRPRCPTPTNATLTVSKGESAPEEDLEAKLTPAVALMCRNLRREIVLSSM